MRLISATLLLFFLIIFSGFSGFKDIQYIDTRNFRISRLDFSGAELALDVVFYNPNGLGARIKNADVYIYINDKYAGKAKSISEVRVPATDTFVVPLKVVPDLLELLPDLLQIANERQARIKLKGRLMVGNGIFIPVPLKYEGLQKW